MSEGPICETCRHYAGHHDTEGKCQFSHPTINKGEACSCESYRELKFHLAEFLSKREEKS